MQHHSPDLSAQDVNLLHHIILRAENQPDHDRHPSKTLLDAYYAVFAENGLDTHNDRACFRLLLQLGRPGIPGAKPYEKFEHLLKEAGIVIEIGDDQQSVAEVERADTLQVEEIDDVGDPANLHTSPRKVARRNSFTSIYDVTTEVARRLRRRSLERLSEPHVDGVSEPPQVKSGVITPGERMSEHAEDLHSISSEEETQTTFDDPEAREAGKQALELALQAAQLLRKKSPLDQETHTRDHLVQIMQIAAQKDRLTLLKQAFALWRTAFEVARQERRVGEIDAAVQVLWEEQYEHAVVAYDRYLLENVFYHWVVRAQESKAKSKVIRKHLLKLKYFNAWQKFTVMQELKVDNFAKKTILSKWIKKIRERKSQYQLVETRVQRMDTWRIARKYFAIWLLRTRMTFEADAVNIQRIKQNAFSAWNEKLRYKATKERIDERVLAEGLYRWVLAQRANLMAKRCDMRRKREAFQALLHGFRGHQTKLATKEAQFSAQKDLHLLRSTWECWKLQMNLQRERDRMAVEFYNPKILLDNLTVWRDRLRHIQRQKLRSQDARYYFVMTKTIKQWHIAAVETKKRRINEAYKTARKMVKVNLLRRVLDKWHARVERMYSMHRQGQVNHDRKARALVQSTFVKWQIGTSQWRQAMQQASAHHENQLLKHSFTALIDASQKAQTLQTWADRFHSVRKSSICSTQLRRISMKAFEIKRRQNDAEAMCERHWAKHVRNILRHWALKSKDVALIPQKPSPLSTDHETVDAGYATGTGTVTAAGSTAENLGGQPAPGTLFLGATQRAEEWTAFDQDLLEGSTTPAYLNTPSKRAARVRALANVTNTPMTPWTAGRSGGGVQLGKITGRRAHLFREIG